jgi:hypothetical protein
MQVIERKGAPYRGIRQLSGQEVRESRRPSKSQEREEVQKEQGVGTVPGEGTGLGRSMRPKEDTARACLSRPAKVQNLPQGQWKPSKHFSSWSDTIKFLF